MKGFLLFLIFFLLGIAIVFGYQYMNPQQFSLGYTKPALTTNFSLKMAPSESLKGTIASMSGSVSWLSRTADKPMQLNSPRIIQQGEEISTGSNGNAVISIQNDASFFLEPNSHVGIIQLLPQNFVFLQDKGIVHYANSIQVPVSIKSLDLLTIVTKGVVVMSVDSKKQIVSVTVERGIVKEGYEDLQDTSNVVTINAGQTFIFDDKNKIGRIQ